MIKTIDVVSTIPTPLTLQEKKIVAVASCHMSLLDTSLDTRQSQF